MKDKKPKVAFILLVVFHAVSQITESKSSSKEIMKAARQLLESEKQLDGIDCKKIRSTDKLRVSGELDLAHYCLLKSLHTNPSHGWNWSQLAEVFSKKGSKSKSRTCFKQALKLSGQLTSSSISKWHVIAPFVSGKTELDGDPVEAYGGIRSVSRWRFNETKDFYSELAAGGSISWKVFEQVSNQPVHISPKIQWGDLVNSLGSLAISEWQGWAIGEFSVNSEKEDISIQCLGVPAVYIDDNLLAGDVYRRDHHWSTVSLSQGIHTVYVKLRAKVTQILSCNLKVSTETFVVHKPSKVPDLVDGHLISKQMPVAVGITNLQGAKWLTNVRFKAKDSDECFTVEESQGVNIAPGQTFLVPIYLTEKSETEVDCSDIQLNLKVLTSSRSSDVSIDLRCRTKSESFIITFEDHDGSVILTLHGTGVPAQNQADSYKYMENGQWVFGLDQAWVLAPTRHGAHNWEGPGSLTAMTALQKLHEYTHQVHSFSWFEDKKASKEEVIFAGHSMGGHGAWHLATHYPQLAKALISLAGWNKKEEYGDSNKFFEFDISSSHTQPSLKAILEMCFTENDVDKLVSNLKGIPVFARIGASDRTVHPFFVRRMYRLLKEEGVNVTYRELKDKEHWWWDTWKTNDGGVVNDPEVRKFMNYYAESTIVTENTCPADGTECDESPGDALWFNRILSDLKSYTFTVLNPVYHGYVHGFKVIQQIIPLRRSTIQMTFYKNLVKVRTTNVLTLSIDLPQELSVQVKPGMVSSWVVCDSDGIDRTWITYGPARRVAEQPFLIVAGFQLNSCSFNDEDVGMLSLAPNGEKHLVLILMGSSISALETLIQLATPTIPPMTRSPFSNMIPDFIITGHNVKLLGPGGYECAGFWGNNWEFRPELASCVC
ncbi:hypothetical protein HOLleu_09229 [Holothuria leucospilota]|uniref:Peptidase S9 prolyl oligopeptidase catalytic domain-containing protein n=1 Tax=Holothuria leucospilota TaxID=206669 RepID=A0A9Q1HE00_HOLLE|nr:hypothetical protein HOLleu_09229 [Holothuria leucospilota]